MGTGFAKLMKQARMMKENFVKTDEVLRNQLAEGSAGGGAVKAVVKGNERLVSIKIEPEVLKSGDVEMLEDLIVAAVNQALDKIEELHKAELDKMTAGLGLTGKSEMLRKLGL